MNPGSQGQGQAPQGQSGGSQPQSGIPRMTLLKPEMMRNLPSGAFSDEDKAKWETGLKGLWTQIENNPAESQANQEARRKLIDFSRSITLKMQSYRAQQAAQQARQVQQAQQGQQGQATQGQQVQQNQQSQQAQQALQPTAAPSNNSPQQRPNPQQQMQVPRSQEDQAGASNIGSTTQQQPRPQTTGNSQEKLIAYIQKLNWVAPPHINPNTEEWGKYIQKIKNDYARTVLSMDRQSTSMRNMEEYIKRRRQERTVTEKEEEDYQAKLNEYKLSQASNKKLIDEIKENQKRFQQGSQPQNAQQNSQNQGQPQQHQQSQASGSAASNSNMNGNVSNAGNHGTQGPQVTQGNQTQAGAPRPPMNLQQSSNPALQNTQTVNAAIEQARNQQMGGGNRPNMPQGQIAQGLQVPAPTAPSQLNMPQSQIGQAPAIKTEPTLPGPINTAITQMQHNQPRPGQTNSPQSAILQSAAPNSTANTGPPRALTHQAALQTAAQSYSSAGGQATGTPTVMGHTHTHPNAMSREQQNPSTQKLPIPKHLPERATAPPQPVQMSQSRPSYTGGPSGAGNGVMGQPVIQKVPAFVPDGEGDRVLSKKKLDELVRQVTGGGENLAGGGLTAEVEEVCFISVYLFALNLSNLGLSLLLQDSILHILSISLNPPN